MRNWLHVVLLGGLLWFAGAAALDGQAPPAPEKTEPPPKYERDGSTATIPYTLALIGVLVVMVLVCMPARRE